MHFSNGEYGKQLLNEILKNDYETHRASVIAKEDTEDLKLARSEIKV